MRYSRQVAWTNELKKKTLSSIAASGLPNASRIGYAKVPRGSEFGRVAYNNVEDLRRDLLPSRKNIKTNGKNAIFFPPPPPTAKLPSSHRYRPDRKADALLPSAFGSQFAFLADYSYPLCTFHERIL